MSPPGPVIERREEDLLVSYRWRRAAYAGHAVVALLAGAAALLAPESLVTLLVLAALAAAFTYSAAMGFLNTTRVEIRQGRLTIRHGPLPWPGFELETAQLEQLYVRPRSAVSRRSGRRLVRTGNERSVWASFDLVALDKAGVTHVLVRGFHDKLDAQQIEDAVEGFLEIVDVPMPDEAPKER